MDVYKLERGQKCKVNFHINPSSRFFVSALQINTTKVTSNSVLIFLEF